MDEMIQTPNKEFDFSVLNIAMPTMISSGIYLTKFERSKSPLYIRTPECKTKDGFQKTKHGKIYCDLLFENSESDFVSWMEQLESASTKLIYEKGDDWFEDPLSLDDIEQAFTSTLKVVKSGTYYSMRVFVASHITKHVPLLKIYDESEKMYSIDEVNSDMRAICILEVQGIQFSSKSFHVDFEMKQMMLLESSSIFDNFILSTASASSSSSSKQSVLKSTAEHAVLKCTAEQAVSNSTAESPQQEELCNEESEVCSQLPEENSEEEFPEIESSPAPPLPEEPNVELEVQESSSNELDESESESAPIADIESQPQEPENMEVAVAQENIPNMQIASEEALNDDLVELSLDMFSDPKDAGADRPPDICDESVEFKLKKPEDVYQQMYLLAKKKAKVAKEEALRAFLEAQKIKHTYLTKHKKPKDGMEGAEERGGAFQTEGGGAFETDSDSDIEEFGNYL